MKPVLLTVMDGMALREEEQGNAFKQADTPNLDKLMEEHGCTALDASGPAVGLPEGFTGNSEVGHLHLGAGRKIPQRLKRIDNAIKENSLKEKQALKEALEQAEEENSTVHFAGMISDGGIHSHIRHLKALMKAASEYSVDVKIHCFTDGRDVEPKSADKYLSQVEDWCKEYGGEIATISGRYYSMDRDHNWERTEKAYKAMTQGEGLQFNDPREPVEETYEEGDYDYFVIPGAREGFEGIENNDQVVFFNFRADRVRQITEAFLKPEFEEFENPVRPGYTSMFRYRKDFNNPVLFEKQVVENTLGEKIEDAGLSQLRVAESQKKPHVTFFFNGQRELEFEHEERHFIESDKIKAFDQKPEMHADDICDVVLEAMEKGEKDFILINYANPDLVGHTGDLDAAIKAVETVDRNIGRLAEKAEENNYAAIFTADHGNCDNMGTEENPNTSHTMNKVPLITQGIKQKPVQEKQLWEIEKIVEQGLELN
ncbi:MAG: 2,3-bisphosphoglycerate-independent phosphoglycerate mutase [Candidatus Nanohalobium sp.]